MITKYPSYFIFGTTTNIGKTLFSAELCRVSILHSLTVTYIKPIQTGYPKDCDATYIKNSVSSPHLTTKTLLAFSNAVSPHRVIKKEEGLNEKILFLLQEEIENCQSQMLLIEGAGGVASPSFSHILQCDLYRKIRLPIIFIGDSQLGGISTTISSIEMALSRGYDICCLILFKGKDENDLFLKEHYKNSFPVFSMANINECGEIFQSVFHCVMDFHKNKIKNFSVQKEIAKQHVWWPFTQHKTTKEARIIDSALGDYFEILEKSESSNNNVLSKNIYDGSASWWTQSIGHADNDLTKTAAATAGRFGHVMYPGNIHEPAVNLIQKLLSTVGNNWAQRVYFADNGSTAIEIALKMAFRKSFGIKKTHNAIIIGLKDSFHGETHATMDATNPNSFKLYDHWYNPRGFWLDYPKIFKKNKQYYVQLPKSFQHNESSDILLNVNSVQEIFSMKRKESAIAEIYLSYIQTQLQNLIYNNAKIGACLLEGVVQGSCGFQFVDPIFQKILVDECRLHKIPIIIDEVLTGLWRLGEVSSSKMLNVKPDIACYGKHLTGGLFPLAAILTTEVIFEGFLGDDISTALLHGHSYTGNTVGCAIAAKSIEKIQNSKNFNPQTNSLIDLWDENIVDEISCLNSVERVYSLGSLLVIELKDVKANYLSNCGIDIVNKLQSHSIDLRALGNVIYIFAGFNTEKNILKNMIDSIYEVLKTCI